MTLEDIYGRPSSNISLVICFYACQKYMLIWLYLVQSKFVKMHYQESPYINRNALELFCMSLYIGYLSDLCKYFTSEGEVFSLKSGRREVQGWIPIRACQPNCSEFSVFFHRNSRKYGLGSLRKTPMEGTPPTGLGL